MQPKPNQNQTKTMLYPRAKTAQNAAAYRCRSVAASPSAGPACAAAAPDKVLQKTNARRGVAHMALLHERLEEELENVAANMASEANWMCDWMFGARMAHEEFKSSQ